MEGERTRARKRARERKSERESERAREMCRIFVEPLLFSHPRPYSTSLTRCASSRQVVCPRSTTSGRFTLHCILVVVFFAVCRVFVFAIFSMAVVFTLSSTAHPRVEVGQGCIHPHRRRYVVFFSCMFFPPRGGLGCPVCNILSIDCLRDCVSEN